MNTRKLIMVVGIAMMFDITGDGKAEGFLGSAYKALCLNGADGKMLWNNRPGVESWGFRDALFAPVDVNGGGQTDAAVLHGPELTAL